MFILIIVGLLALGVGYKLYQRYQKREKVEGVYRRHFRFRFGPDMVIFFILLMMLCMIFPMLTSAILSDSYETYETHTGTIRDIFTDGSYSNDLKATVLLDDDTTITVNDRHMTPTRTILSTYGVDTTIAVKLGITSSGRRVVIEWAIPAGA